VLGPNPEDEIQPDLAPGEMQKAITRVAEEVKARTNVDPVDFRASRNRSVHDLPAEGSMMRAIAIVLVLTLFGVGDREMADFLGLKIDDVKRVRSHQGYTELFHQIVNEIVNVNSSILRGRIASYGNATLDELISLALSSKKETIRLAGVKDVLDRIGVGKEDEKDRANAGIFVNLRIDFQFGFITDIGRPFHHRIRENGDILADKRAAPLAINIGHRTIEDSVTDSHNQTSQNAG